MVSKALRNLLAGLTILGTLLLSGCGGLAPVYTVGERGPGTYVVKKGDTLYSIAFRYGMDYKSLARLNGIGPPYTIYVDQTLRLKGGRQRSTTIEKPREESSPAPKVMPAGVAKVEGWRWPHPGEIIKPFSLTSPVNKGIDIKGKRGDPVKAAADGTIVYAGGNLRGYGKLVIVKHNDNFLSAYGNNDSILVREGDEVRRGKTIARVGANASNIEMLHFEIRRNGKPEDPLKFLPSGGSGKR